MSSFEISIPYYDRLTSPGAWDQAEGEKRAFEVVRLHYYFRRRDNSGSLFSGEPIADISVAKGVKREDVEEWSGKIERTDVTETAREIVRSLEAADRLATDIKAAIGPEGVLGIGSSSEITRTFKEQARDQITNRASSTISTEWKHTQSITVTGNETANLPLYLVSKYRKIGYDVFLSYFDYLRVSYEKQRWWQRPRRVKTPPAPQRGHDWRKASNVSPPLNIPLKTIWLWELADTRYPVVSGDYEIEVGNPHTVLAEPLNEEGPTYRFPVSKQYSLYRAANLAFELKWSRAAGKRHETERADHD